MDLEHKHTLIFYPSTLPSALANQHLPKRVQMVNPGSFQGARKEFLLGEKPAYAAGVVGGYAGDALALIQRRYFKRFPVELAHEVEPSAEDLEAVDDDAPEQEHHLPDPETVGEDEHALAVKALEERSKLVRFRKAQIKRWLAYQYMKDNDLDPKDSGAQNPYRVLLHKLTGVGITRPRAKSTVNIWRKTQRAAIDDEAYRRIAAAGLGATHKKNLAAIRDRVARDLFTGLSNEEQEEWVDRAREENEASIERWKRDTEGPPSKEPADRQRCIQGLVRFAQPILDAICQATGWSATLIAGGPEPADGGRLNVVSVHSGTTSGDVKMNFGRADRARFKKIWVPMYGQFLQKCYTLEECRARALPVDEGHLALSGLDMWDEDGATFDSIVPPSTLSSAFMPSSSRAPALTHASAIGPPSLASTQAMREAPFGAPPSVSQSPVLSAPSEPRATSQAPFPSPSLPRQPVPSPPHSPAPSPPHSPAPSPPHSPAPSPPHSPAPSPPHSPAPSHLYSPDPLPSRPYSPEQPAAAHPPGLPMPQPGAIPSRTKSPASAPVALQPGSGTAGRQTNSPAKRSPSKRRRNAPPSTAPVAKRSGKRRHDALDQADHAPANKRTRASAGTANLPPTSAKATGSRPKPRPKQVPVPLSTAPAPLQRDEPQLDKSHATLPATSAAPQINKDPNVPAWFSRAYSMLHDGSLGARWCALISVWAAFEKKEGYAHIVKLKTTHRPSVVT